MTWKTSRRNFIQSSAALGTAWWVGSNSSLYADSKNPVERLNIACIGVGGKGNSDSSALAREGNIVAICDVDDNKLGAKAKSEAFSNAKQFNDYRLMLDQMGDEIDVVSVSTPDHHHAPAAIRAMKLGIHCYVQKPLTWSVEEARMMRLVAAEKRVVTQMGNQGTALDGLREAVEIVRSGGIGAVKEVHIWTNRPVWPQGTGRPKGSSPVPNSLRWHLFLGPAQDRPYLSAVYHPFKWRGWVDFGTGALGDMACHTANMAVMALQLFDPVSIEADSAGIVENETFPSSSTITFEFPERKDVNGETLPACTLKWYDGGNKPPAELLQGQQQASSGSLLVGDKGTLYSPNDYGAKFVLLPEEDFADYKKPEPSLPRSIGHYKEFAEGCRGGSMPMSNFDYAGRLTETILLGNVAMRANEKIEWDAKNMHVKNVPSANQYVSREYREGWWI